MPQVIYRRVTHAEQAHRYRQYGMYDEAAQQDAREAAHRAKYGEVIERRVYEPETGQFLYVRGKPAPRQHGVNPNGVPHDFAPWRERWWLHDRPERRTILSS